MERSRFVLNAILLASLMTGCSGSMGDSVSDGTMGETFGDAPDDATADDAVPPPPDVGGDEAGEPGDTTWPDPEVDPGVRMRTSGWMAGDLHLHSQHSDGEDSVAAVIQLAEYLEDPVFLAAHPEYHGNPLDFLSITDHRTVSQQSDPDHHSDRLVLLGGEEYGGPGHACLWGITEHIPHGDTHESYRQGVEAAHAAGGLFSINHPFTAKITFPWDVRTHDALEVVNTRWGVMGPSIAPEFLEAWELEHGPASPFFRKATLFPGIGGNQQALVFYEAQLTLGVHVALVGGSDRHTLFPVGFPTTWVRSEGPDAQGILEGIRRRHTFVSRTPVSATVEVEVTTASGTWEMGDEVPIRAAGEELTVTVRVGRARGSLLRLVRGHRVATDEELTDAELGRTEFETPVPGNDFIATVPMTVLPGDWVYPLVLEPLIPEDLPPELAAAVPSMAAAVSQREDEGDFSPILEAVWDYIDLPGVINPKSCDPAAWNPDHLQCLPVDDNGIASYFFPDWIDRAFNVRTEDGEATSWAMGSVGSAVVFTPQQR